jgi:hypothetical protein
LPSSLLRIELLVNAAVDLYGLACLWEIEIDRVQGVCNPPFAFEGDFGR